MKNVLKSMLFVAMGIIVAAGFTACSKDEVGPKDKTKKLVGPKPAKVVINVYEGHLHGYAGFHENGMYDGAKIFGAPQQFVFTMQNGKWVADAENPPYLYAMSYNKYQNTEAAVSHALDIKYYDAAGKLINGEFIENGKSDHYQHFFVVESQKAFPDFDKKLDNPGNHEFMRYDYVDPTPWNETIHSKKGHYNGLKDPLGFKGIMSFGYCRQTCNLNIMLMESHDKKNVRLKDLEFKDNNGNLVKSHLQVADWTPTQEQLSNEKWYPTITIPIMVYMDRDELGDGEEEITLDMKEEDVPAVYKRLINTLKSCFNKPYKEVLRELYYRLNGEPAPHNDSGFWF
ncbi:hypothetical protein [Prevotella falsenii]|uniref:hypothetical protein n=1 Tax=Prevotella falsenii TaxID=515414 RepID=UPI00046AB55A|nr:hypothetical protein [Prevotella falsenii]